MKKRVMYITQSNGGVAKYLEMLFKYQDRNRYEKILIYPTEYIEEKGKFENLVDNIEFVDMGRDINIVKDLKAIIEISKLIKKYKPDLIYAQSSKGGALARVANRIRLGACPILYNPHGWSFNMDTSLKKKKLYKIIEKMLAKINNKIIVISEQEKNSALINNICKEDKLQVIVNGIDIEAYDNYTVDSNLREKYNINKDATVIGMVGRISKQKAPEIFIKIAARIKEEIKNSFFIIVGDGEDREAIEDLIKNLKIEQHVLITGWVDNPYEYIKLFDIAMLLSRWEGFGLAIAEYMVAKKPIIATNVDAIPNLIQDNFNGLLIDVNSVDQGVESIKRIMRDKTLKEKLIYNSDVRVRKEFNVKRVAYEHEQIFNQYMIH